MVNATEDHTFTEIARRLAKTSSWNTAKMPCDYLILDTETTGFSSEADRILSVGFGTVQDCQLTFDICEKGYDSIVLKWPKEVFKGKEKAIEINGITYEVSQEKGVEPRDAMQFISDLLMWADEQEMYVVGHNIVGFDYSFLNKEMQRAGLHATLDPNTLLDTQLLCKAAQLGMLPGENESSLSYFSRVRQFRAAGVYSNLDRYCVKRFGLFERFGADPSQAHDAGYDCWLTHLVVQSINEIIEGSTQDA